MGWVGDRIREFRYRRNREAAGAYEEPLNGYGRGGGGGRGGFGPLDPDEAWDARVGTEPGADYDEEEVGLQRRAETAYEGAGGEERGRGRRRDESVDRAVKGKEGGRYDEEMGLGGQGRAERNPFDDDAGTESLRGVSPRPAEADKGKGHQKSHSVDAEPDSPTERRSMFRENV